MQQAQSDSHEVKGEAERERGERDEKKRVGEPA
jgi:hypothetical protein